MDARQIVGQAEKISSKLIPAFRSEGHASTKSFSDRIVKNFAADGFDQPSDLFPWKMIERLAEKLYVLRQNNLRHWAHCVDERLAQLMKEFLGDDRLPTGAVQIIGHNRCAMTFDKLHRRCFRRLGARRGARFGTKGNFAPHRWEPVRRSRKAEILGNLLNERRRDFPFVQGISVDHRVVADHVDQAWNTARILMNHLHGFSVKHSRVAAGMPQAIEDVFLAFRKGQWAKVMAQSDALPQLPELRRVESFVELGLTDEQNLQQLVFGGLEI